MGTLHMKPYMKGNNLGHGSNAIIQVCIRQIYSTQYYIYSLRSMKAIITVLTDMQTCKSMPKVYGFSKNLSAASKL